MELVEYAFETWDNNGMSRLHVGKAANEFIKQHHNSGTYATLHAGGKETLRQFIACQERLQKEGWHGL